MLATPRPDAAVVRGRVQEPSLRRPHTEPSLPFGLPRAVLAGVVPIALALIAVAITLATGSAQGSGSAPTRGTSLQAIAAAETSQATTTAVASPTPLTNRKDCALVRGSGYLSLEERDWYLANCSGTPMASSTAGTAAVSSSPVVSRVTAPPPPPAPSGPFVTGAAPGPVADRMVISRLGIDASVHASVVASDGVMGNPDGPYDIVWYDFSGLDGPGLGGYPGKGGNAVYAGHVDYHPHIEAVFWTLRNAKTNDVIDYYTYDGRHLVYTVQWVQEADPDADFSVYVGQTGQDVMTLITCDGIFDPVTRHYDHRSVVRALRTA